MTVNWNYFRARTRRDGKQGRREGRTKGSNVIIVRLSMGNIFSHFLILNLILKHEYVNAKFNSYVRVIVIFLFMSVSGLL